AGDWVKTTADPTLNLRAGPSTADEILTALPVGTLARVRDHANNGIHANSNSWWYVEVHPGGERGWLAEFYLEKTEGPGDPSVDLIIDNSSPGFSASASWGSATWAADKFGADYRFRAVEAISDRASWTAELPFAGSYQVYAWWSSASDRSQSAPYTVAHAGGDQLVRVNQREGGGQWNLLGTYDFSAGPAHVYLSCWTSNSGSDVVIADAVRFVTFDEPPPVVYRALAIEIDGDGSVLQTPQADEYADGTMVQFQAVPGEGYAFLEWSGDLSSAQNPLNLIIDRDYSLVARFGRTYAAWVQQYFSP